MQTVVRGFIDQISGMSEATLAIRHDSKQKDCDSEIVRLFEKVHNSFRAKYRLKGHAQALLK